MSRKPKWTPNPECHAAYARAFELAYKAAAHLFGEKPVENPEGNASDDVFIMATGMIFFLLRMDPKDAQALFAGEGSFGSLDRKSFPPSYWLQKGVFAQ